MKNLLLFLVTEIAVLMFAGPKIIQLVAQDTTINRPQSNDTISGEKKLKAKMDSLHAEKEKGNSLFMDSERNAEKAESLNKDLKKLDVIATTALKKVGNGKDELRKSINVRYTQKVEPKEVKVNITLPDTISKPETAKGRTFFDKLLFRNRQ